MQQRERGEARARPWLAVQREHGAARRRASWRAVRRPREGARRAAFAPSRRDLWGARARVKNRVYAVKLSLFAAALEEAPHLAASVG